MSSLRNICRINRILICIFIILLINQSIIHVIKAMSDRFFVNKYPGFDIEEGSEYLDGFKLAPELIANSNRLIEQLYPKINIEAYGYRKKNDYSIYTGSCGIALLHYLKFLKTKDQDSFNMSKYLIEKIIPNLSGKDISFLIGDAGPLALGAIIYAKEDNKEESDKLIERLIKLPETVPNYPNEILFGRAGYIYALLYVQKHLGEVIPIAHLRNQVQQLVNSGKRKSNKLNSSVPLRYEWNGENYLGAAHGVAGILYILLLNKDLLSQRDLHSAIKPTLDWLITQRYPSGNFLSSENSKTDKLVQWCHGAPGFVHLFTLANKVYGEENYLNLALECGEIVWNRGLLQKGYSICHGVAGNAYTFSHLYRATHDLLHYHRLGCFVHWVNTYPKNEGMKPDRPLSVFEGASGVAYFLTDIQSQRPSFPGYEITN